MTNNQKAGWGIIYSLIMLILGIIGAFFQNYLFFIGFGFLVISILIFTFCLAINLIKDK